VNTGVCYQSFVETLCLRLQECQKGCLEEGDSIHFYAAGLYIKGYTLLYPRRLESTINSIKDISLFGQFVTEYKVKYRVSSVLSVAKLDCLKYINIKIIFSDEAN